MKLEPYSFGTGDRFGLQGAAQLAAIRDGAAAGADIAIVWNKSHREHTIVGTVPADVRREADRTVASSGWKQSYYVDADHIGLDTVDRYLDASDFFTIDVADFINKKAPDAEIAAFVDRCRPYTRNYTIPGLAEPMRVGADQLRFIGEKYLSAIGHAAHIYNRIAAHKGSGTFVTEISMDETDDPQTPEELFCILAMVAHHRIPAQTIAPKFSGRFNKGVDYQGDVDRFNREFEADLCVIRHALDCFDLENNLKLSVHSGSDKFSIYPGIHAALVKHGAGVHVKTAGTTWLEELIGLAESGDDGLALVKRIYRGAWGRYDELCGPYRSVIDIERNRLPDPDAFDGWDGGRVKRTLQHDQRCEDYSSDVRQLLHVAYKIAAEIGKPYLEAVTANEAVIAGHVRENLFKRHIAPLFLGIS